MDIDFSVVDALKEDTFLGLLSKEDFNEFFSSLKKKTVNKGEVLIKEHQAQTEAFIIESGKIEKSHNGGDVSHIGPGSIVGLLHLVNKDPSFATLTAEQQSVVLVVNADAFLSLLKNRESFNKSYITFLSKQLRQNSNALRGIKSKLSPSGINVAFFDTKSYMKEYFEKINKEGDYKFVIHWFKEKLNRETALLASGSQVVCCFVNDTIDAETIEKLNDDGIKMIALRCAGYDMIDLEAAKKHNMSITRVPAYSPYAVAEFAITLIMALNRNIHKAFNRVREHNFSLNNLVGFDMHGKTVGLLGTGQIGACTANILLGFGCKVIAYDIKEDAEMKKKGVEYVTKENLYAQSDIISIHLPLLKSTQHMLNGDAFKQMKKGVILINTSRGGIVDSKALLEALSSGIVGGAGLDVYEEEKAYFFENRSDSTIQDEVLTRLIASHNVIVTSHQAFLTQEALSNIATSTLDSIKEFASGKEGSQLKNAVVQQYK